MTRSPQGWWRAKPLEEMSPDEWERLCDGCGRCCLVKLQDEDTDEIYVTRAACRLLDIGSCRCGDYRDRHAKVPDCVVLRPDNLAHLPWLPDTCAYRLLAEGRDLYWWHPLVSGDAETVHAAGISVRNSAVSEEGIPVDKLQNYIARPPKRRRRRSRARNQP